MIILEGPDRCGKTSVSAALLSMDASLLYHHFTKPPQDPFEYFARFFTTTRPNVVVDRCHWSEPAYGRVYRDGSKLSDTQFIQLDMMLLASHAQIIYMYDEPSQIRSRWSSKEMFPSDKIEGLLDVYNGLFNNTPILSYRCKLENLVKNGRPTKMLEEILVKDVYNSVYTKNALAPGVAYGNNGGFLIAGDEPNLNNVPSGGVSAPFIYGNSAEWLWTSLQTQNIDLNKAKIVNVTHLHDRDLTKLFTDGNFKKIVCLGNKAYQRLFDYQIVSPFSEKYFDISVIHHPSYARRFGNKFVEWSDSLAKELKDFVKEDL